MADFLAHWVTAPIATLVSNCNLWEWPLALLLLGAVWRGWLPVPGGWLRGAYRCARWPLTAYLSLPLVLLLVRALLLPLRPVPIPYIPDEWSHQLLADTLLAGRLANPPHPLWQFFETIHVLPLPSYASMYLPGSAIFLAAGKFLFGTHYGGVLLSCILLTVTALWALRAWLPPFWAWWAALLVVGKVLLNGAMNGYWLHSYWGGAPGAIGGALLLGAAGRLRTRPTPGNGLVFGAGLVLLAITRPFEGAVLGFAVSVWVGVRFWRGLVRPAFAAALVLGLGGLAVAQFCRAVTGSPWQMPYFANQQRYGWPMTAMWMKPEPKPVIHPKLVDYWEWEREEHTQIESLRAILQHAPIKINKQWIHYVGPLLTIPLAALVAAIRGRRMGGFALLTLLGLIVVCTEQSAFPHYFAPFAIPAVAVLAWTCRQWIVRQPRIATPYLFWLPAALLAAQIPRSLAPIIVRPEQMSSPDGWCCRYGVGSERAGVASELEKDGGSHLVLVRYSRRDPDFTLDWVYNPPVIDSARVVFARDLGEPRNQALRDYYPGRTFWVVIPDRNPIVFERCGRQPCRAGDASNPGSPAGTPAAWKGLNAAQGE